MKQFRLALTVIMVLAACSRCPAAVPASERAAADTLTRARLALKQKDTATAKALFETVYKEYPNVRQAPAALLSHAYLLVAAKDPNAEDEFRAVATRYPQSPEAPRAWLRVAYQRLSKKEADAATYLTLIVTQYPKAPAAQEALYRLARLDKRVDDLDNAQATLEAAVAAPGGTWQRSQALVHLGDVHISRFLKTKDEEELHKASNILLRIEDKFPKESRSIMQGRVDMARLYAFVGVPAGLHDPAKARAILVEGLEKWPDTYNTMEAHTLVGLAFNQEGKPQSAVDYFENVIKDFPKSDWNTMLLYQIGNLYRNMGNVAKANEAYGRCVALDAKTVWAESSRQALTSSGAAAQ